MQSVAEIEASPEVQDLRNRVSGFLSELIYPTRRFSSAAARKPSRTFQSNSGGGEKARAVGARSAQEIGGGGPRFMP